VTLTASPQALQQLVARDDAALLKRKRIEQSELGRRQLSVLSVHERLHFIRVDAELLDLDRLTTHLLLRLPPPSRLSLDACNELLHREWLHEVVVGSDLERVYAIVLCATCADDDDGRADAFAAYGLYEVPSVAARQHEVEHADIRMIEAEPCQALLATRGSRCVESCGLEMLHHPACDDLVVLDDQDLRHRGPTIVGWTEPDW
jgi:hypothetical protein